MATAPDPAVFEKLGAFYLGRPYDAATQGVASEPLLYPGKDLLTHAVCVGMTGSGKTGLCIGLLEEAAIDGIPSIVVDPKGDLGNLLLTFPGLRAADFRPWVDEGEAARAGLDLDGYAEATARRWADGLAAWGQDGRRIQRLREAAEAVIYTPGSSAGRSLTVLRSFGAPPPAVRADADALREQVSATVSGLLALVGLDVDPVQSREHILLSTLVQQAWREGQNLDLPAIIRYVQHPPIDRIGVMDLETFFPERDRSALALRINGVLASPGFQGWLDGEPLDIGRLLWTPEGRPRIAILSIAHLSDPERMFFVTILLNELVGWMRQQPGTSSLRAVFYMDEIFGYFPPTAMPPSKVPMLTLLKQARAYGLGIVLSTQNPVDLDYKGLANTGTWFLGRLQTERDKLRVLEGLEGASAATGGSFDRGQYERILAGLKSRVFLMNSVHDDGPVLFQTRWTLSYLRGPLTRLQIQRLTAEAGAAGAAAAGAAATLQATGGHPGAAGDAPTAAIPAQARAAVRDFGASSAGDIASRSGPILAPGTSPPPTAPAAARMAYLAVARHVPGGRLAYQPALLGQADLHFVRGAEVDVWETRTFLAPLAPDVGARAWDQASPIEGELELVDEPDPEASFTELPDAARRSDSYRTWEKSFDTFLYRVATLTLYAIPELRLVGRPGETEADLRIRARDLARERRDEEVERLRRRYAPKVASLQERLRRAQDRVGREQSQVQQQGLQTAISFGATVLGALFGRKAASVGTVGRATTAARGAGRVAREQQDVARAREEVARLERQLADLEAEAERETMRLAGAADADASPIAQRLLRPRKADTTIRRVSLVWLPSWVDATGTATAAWQTDPPLT